jgi:hypothetical protein
MDCTPLPTLPPPFPFKPVLHSLDWFLGTGTKHVLLEGAGLKSQGAHSEDTSATHIQR